MIDEEHAERLGEDLETDHRPYGALMIPSTLIDDGPAPEFPSDIPFYPYHYSDNIGEKHHRSTRKDREEMNHDLEPNEFELFSAKKLKSMLKENLSKSHSVQLIKAKLRKEFIKEITNQSNKQQKGSDKTEVTSSRPLLSLEQRLILSLLYAHLQHHHYYHTISVFLAESGLEDKTRSVVSEYDVSQLFLHHVALPADLAVTLKEHFPHATVALRSTSKPRSKREDDEGQGGEDENNSLLDIFLHYFLHPSVQRDHRKEIAIQTDEQSAEGIREMLIKQMQELNNSAEQKKIQVSSLTSQTMEEKYLHYQKECQLMYQREYEQSVKFYQENDRLKIQMQETERANKTIELYRSQFEAEYQQRFQHYLEREQAFQKQIKQQEEKSQQIAHEQRQALLQQLQTLQQQETSLKRKYELEREGLVTLEHHLKQLEGKLMSKEKELELKDRQYSASGLELREQIRREVQKELHFEYTSLQEERVKFIQERKILHEDQLRWQEKMQDYEMMSDQLKQAKQALASAEERLVLVEHEKHLLVTKEQLEEKAMSELLTSVSPDLIALSGLHRVLELVKQNKELQATLDSYSDAKQLKELYDTSQHELMELQMKYREKEQITQIEKAEVVKERDRLKEENVHLAAKVRAFEYQLVELRQLLTDKERNVRILERERLVAQQQLRTARATTSAAPSQPSYHRERSRAYVTSDYPPSHYNSYPRETAERPFTISPTADSRHVSFAPPPSYEVRGGSASGAVGGEAVSEESKYRLEEYKKLQEKREQIIAAEEAERKRRQDQQFQQQLAALESERKRLQDRELMVEKEKQLEVLRLQQEYQLTQLEKEKELLRQQREHQQQQLFQYQQLPPQQPVFVYPQTAATTAPPVTASSSSSMLAPPLLSSSVVAQPTTVEMKPKEMVVDLVSTLKDESALISTINLSPPTASSSSPTFTATKNTSSPPSFFNDESERRRKREEEEEKEREREKRAREAEKERERERETIERDRQQRLREEEAAEEERRRRAKEEKDRERIAEEERLERERKEAAEELARERQRLKEREQQERDRQRQEAEREKERERQRQREQEEEEERERQRRKKDEEDALTAKDRERQKELEEIEAARAKVLARRAQQRKSFATLTTSEPSPVPSNYRLSDSDEEEQEKNVPAPRAIESPLPFQASAKPNTTTLPATRNTVTSSTATTLLRTSSGARPRFDFSDDESDDKIEVGDEDESGLGGKW